MHRMNPRAHGLSNGSLCGQFLAWYKRMKIDGYYAQYTYKVTHHLWYTHTKTCGTFWERVALQTLLEINLGAILYKWTFYWEISSETCTCKHNCVFRRDQEPSRIWEATLKRLRRKGRELKEFVYEWIRLCIPKSSWLLHYVQVRRVTKNVCKLHTKRVRLN